MKAIHNLDLTDYNSYHLYSVAEKAYFPESIEEITNTVKTVHPIIIGGGCNIIFTKKYYTEPIMFIRDNYAGIIINGNQLIVKAGTDLKYLSEFALNHSLSGVESYYDIPGCVGGATIMNAGSGGGSFSDVLDSVTYYDIDRDIIITKLKDELNFEYRNNVFTSMKVVILEVCLSLKEGDKDEIQELMVKNKENRWAKQPREFPSAGSVFKRPLGHYVGPMITEVGLKGFRIGGAMISDKHAGFIVNLGSATAKDILDLINLVKKTIKEKFDIDLVLEQRLI